MCVVSRAPSRGVVDTSVGDVNIKNIKYSNQGGPGPRYNMKEVPGSILIMLVVHAYPEPLFSEAGDKETRGMYLPLHQSNLGKAPSRPLQVHTPPPCKDADRDHARWKSHFSL
jgi:hypothetical protein